MERCEREIVQEKAGNGRCALLLAALSGLFITVVAYRVEAQEVRYVYDAKGQISSVIDTDGSAATYQWDENGNLLGITRVNASGISGPVGITLVSPNSGKSGDSIELFGKGLANPTSLTFNGVAATVTTSTSTYIKTTVPTGANTGLIHVVTPLGQADSPSAFTVLSAMTISPTQAAVLPTRTQQFSAAGAATWTVNGVVGGMPQLGTIDTNGLYTAPSGGTFPLTVTVAAQSPGDPQNRAEAAVTILPVPVARATRLTIFVVPGGPTQASPLRASRVTLNVPPPGPTQATPLRANRVSVNAPPGGPPQASPLTATRVSVERQPVITAVSPGSVARGASNVTLTLTGVGLTSPAALQFLRNGANDALITYSGLTASSDTQATVTISVAATAVIAGRVLQITAGSVNSTPAGTGTNVLQVTGP